jgi:hypothetical protein
MKPRGVLCIALLALGALSLTACANYSLLFTADDRVHVTAPAENSAIRLPFVLRWSARGAHGPYAVFFDASPMRPGASLLSLVPKQDPCRNQAHCPDVNWLRDRDIYVTYDTHLKITSLPDLRLDHDTTDAHYVTIVLLDDSGHRQGESAFTRNFIVDRNG